MVTPHIYCIHADIVVHEIEAGNGVHVVDAAMPAMGPDRLVLRLFGQVVAILVVVYPGALDDAAAVAAVGGAPPTLHLQLGHGLAADLDGTGELTLFEIVSRVAPRLVEDVGQDVGAVGRQGLTGDRVLA